VEVAEELARRAAAAVDNARLYRDAQEALHARDDFLTSAAHEFRTPLTTLRLHVQSIARSAHRSVEVGDAARLATKLDVVDAQVERMSALVDRLLDVSVLAARRLPLVLEQLDLAALAREVAVGFDSELQQAGCRLTLDLQGPSLGTWDRARLDQLLTNLLSNALKYGRGKPVEISVGGTDRMARLVVRDHGIGIEQHDHARIFGRFERGVSSSNFAGFGVGLWIARTVVEALGGTIEVESKVGHGATFTVLLPRAGVAVSASGRPSAAASAA
jgi:signal transduction histidine kinase